MKSTPEVYLIEEVAVKVRLAPVSIYKEVSDSRKGIGSFPLPISKPGGKLRWLASDIEAYLQSLSNNDPPAQIASTSKRRQESKAFKQRQAAAQKALERHRSDHTTKRRPVKKDIASTNQKFKLPEPLPLRAADE
ncbi:MAG: hypothetical protein LBI05_03555 [Planctomycetaceae bacterium]|jgi:predicted DNA-binding transcriptional regulator AlpA|nr:hypothetical protein [Planctomycetaceae bacterium]